HPPHSCPCPTRRSSDLPHNHSQHDSCSPRPDSQPADQHRRQLYISCPDHPGSPEPKTDKQNENPESQRDGQKLQGPPLVPDSQADRKSTRLNSSHVSIS